MNGLHVVFMFYFYFSKIYFYFHAFVCATPHISCGGQKRVLNSPEL